MLEATKLMFATQGQWLSSFLHDEATILGFPWSFAHSGNLQARRHPNRLEEVEMLKQASTTKQPYIHVHVGACLNILPCWQNEHSLVAELELCLGATLWRLNEFTCLGTIALLQRPARRNQTPPLGNTNC